MANSITLPSQQKLHAELLKRKTLFAADLDRMFSLMSENYEKVNESTFLKDLSNKQLVLVFKDDQATIQGFTTFAVNPAGCGGKEYNIVFSGDTIISPAYWGSQEMVRGWCTTVGRLVAGQPDLHWYWYLMSKGHRTYMYLPLFFKEYYPSSGGNYPPHLPVILNECSQKMFGANWFPDEGLIRFKQPMGELKPELAQATFLKQHKPEVNFFLKKNPEFFKGHELACLTSLAPENFNPRCLPFIHEGWQSPLHIHDLY